MSFLKLCLSVCCFAHDSGNVSGFGGVLYDWLFTVLVCFSVDLFGLVWPIQAADLFGANLLNVL